MDKQSLVLIVDEDPNFREIFIKELGARGFVTETAGSGEEGIEKAKKLKPDLILMDVKMPGMDGIEAAMKIKDDPETKDIKVVFLTSFGNSEDEIHSLNVRYSKEIGADGYIRKTDDLDSIILKIKGFV